VTLNKTDQLVGVKNYVFTWAQPQTW
jgi:hypothetical protein